MTKSTPTAATVDVQRTSLRRDDRPYLQNPILVIHEGGWAEVLGEAKLVLPKGVKEVEVLGLPDEHHFVAGSLRLDGISGGDVREVEVNYEPPTQGSMSSLLRGLEVEVESDGGNGKVKKYSGRLISDNGDSVELLVGNGDDAKPVKVNGVTSINYPCLPSNFRTNPSVVLTTEAEEAGDYQADLRLMTKGLKWGRAYEIELDRTTGKAKIKGIVNLPNTSSVDWFGATVVLVQGKTGSPDEVQYDDYQHEGVALRAAASPMGGRVKSVNAKQLAAGDVKIYVLPGKFNLKDKSQKTVTFFRAEDVPFEIEYRLNLGNRWWYNPAHINAPKVAAHVKIKNVEGGPINQVLPGASFSVREKSSELGRTLQGGKGTFDDLLVGEEVDEKFTDAVDIVVDITVGEVKKVKTPAKAGKDEKAKSYELRPCTVKLTNRGDKPVTVRVAELFDSYGELQPKSQFKLVSGSEYEASVTVEPGDDGATLEYTVKVPVNE